MSQFHKLLQNECLKLIIQTYQMKNKELKMKLWQLQEEISKVSLPVSDDLSNDFESIFLETDQRKNSNSWGYFERSSKNIYSLLKIMLHVTQWTLLHIGQSIYLVLTNVLSTSFLMFHITFDEIGKTLSIKFC